MPKALHKYLLVHISFNDVGTLFSLEFVLLYIIELKNRSTVPRECGILRDIRSIYIVNDVSKDLWVGPGLGGWSLCYAGSICCFTPKCIML